MKKVLLIAIAAALILCGCAAQTEPAAPAPDVAPDEPQVVEEAPAFDLAAYKEAVDQFRRDVVDDVISVGNIATYELRYMQSSETVSGKADSESTLNAALKWIEEETGVVLADIEAADKQIRAEYAALITTEIEGKEAEELDAYVRAMYDGYSALYKAATTASPASSGSFALDLRDALVGIQDANGDISLFCGEYGE